MYKLNTTNIQIEGLWGRQRETQSLHDLEFSSDTQGILGSVLPFFHRCSRFIPTVFLRVVASLMVRWNCGKLQVIYQKEMRG